MNQKPSGPTSVVSSSTLLKTEGGGQVKVEGVVKPPPMEGSARRDQPGKEGDWCAVCHDGGDTLYCCDKCPKVYHLFCYIPPLTSEPADDWVCLMCASVGDVKAVMPEL